MTFFFARLNVSLMKHSIICSSHTVSGVMPGSARASRYSLDQRLKAISAAGYVGYWLHFRDYLEQLDQGLDDSAIKAQFNEAGMRYRGIEFLSDWFIDTDEAAWHQDAAFAAGRAIGATILNVGADFQGRGFTRTHMVQAFEKLCKRAESHGMSIALEFVPWSDVPDLTAAMDFMAPDNAGLAIDCWHVFRGTTSLAEVEAVPAEKILCVQVNDAGPADGPLAQDTQRRRFCGEGEFDLPAFLASIHKTGVDVPLSVEIISPEIAAMPLEEASHRSFSSTISI